MIQLKKYRLKSGLKISAIIAKVGISRETLYNYEIGKKKPKFETMVKLAKIYGCSVSDFVDEDQINEGETKARYSVD